MRCDITTRCTFCCIGMLAITVTVAVLPMWIKVHIAQLTGKAVEYTHCFSAEGVRPPTKKNECPRYNTKQSDVEVLIMLELWGNAEYPFITITPRSTLVAPDRVLSMGQIELNCVLMLN